MTVIRTESRGRHGDTPRVAGTPLLCRQAGRARGVQPGEKQALGRPQRPFQCLKIFERDGEGL